MRILQARAIDQGVITQEDFQRVTQGMNDDEVSEFKKSVYQIDSINGVDIASLFNRDESILDRGVLQGGINVEDYTKLSQPFKEEFAVKGMRVINDIPTVNVFDHPEVTRADFEAMTPQQRVKTVEARLTVVDELSAPNLTKQDIHEASSIIARLTKVQGDGKEA